MKTYVITLSKYFPVTMPMKGFKTNFADLLDMGIKKHTIRGNYDFWKGRIDKINEGLAILSIRQWSGKPYQSKQVELKQFNKVGIQKINLNVYENAGSAIIEAYIDGKQIDNYTGNQLILNDGLSIQNFIDWFQKPVLQGCIIHFSDLRY